ncbi:hypothetical protein ATCCBAA256_31170 [Mycobacterium montefiorense]|nr:hypothetical protein ATCCBAA256_31170 [Mycobacterium montefiorense]
MGNTDKCQQPLAVGPNGTHHLAVDGHRSRRDPLHQNPHASMLPGRMGTLVRVSVLVAFSVTPLGVGEGVGEIVAEAVRVVRESGLPNKTDSMFTVIEGDTWEEVMTVVQRAVEAVAARAPRVSTVIKADWRAGVQDAMTQKVETVERHLTHG